MSLRLRAFLIPLAAAVLLAACSNGDGAAADAPSGDPTLDAAAGEATEPQTVDLVQLGFNEGDEATAVLFVLEFSDFGCVFCARFHEDTYPELYREFIEAGDVAWKYIPVTIGGFPNGQTAALAGECAGAQERFPVMRDHLFGNRTEWLEADPAEAEEIFVRYARELGLDVEAFEACLASEEAASRIAMNDVAARRIGVRATPTFLVNGEPVEGAVPLETFQEVFRRAIPELRDPGSAR